MKESEPFVDYLDQTAPSDPCVDELRRHAVPLIVAKYKQLAERSRRGQKKVVQTAACQ